jgi:hypothetical protein
VTAERSVLELRRGGVPFPHGGLAGEWRYRHAVRPEGPTPLDSQAVADFHAYERAHGRAVEVVVDPDLGEWRDWPRAGRRVAPAEWPSQCCTHAYPDGCASPLVVHGTTAAAARSVLSARAIRPATEVTGRSGADLAPASTWGEPADYFEHVMLANGRCTAPEAVARSRALGRDLVPTDLAPGYPPAVRFYFRWEEIVCLPGATFDGVHPVKVAGALSLEHLVAVVVHATQAAIVTRDLAATDRVIVLDGSELSASAWATMADEAAAQ